MKAAPFTARQCPECSVWVYVADGPFAEGDKTKTLAEFLHWRDEHETEADRISEHVVGFPYFRWNESTVDAVKEDRAL